MPRSPLPPNRSPLHPAAFLPLPLGSVKPAGWLRAQLKIQADGITGHLDEYWDDVGRKSGWLGGPGDDWERAPYYLDGLLPLGYLLDDARLIAKAHPYIDWMLRSARPNGFFGPANPDWWTRMVALKVLMQYYEVSGDRRALDLMLGYCRYQSKLLDSIPLYVWGAARGSDNLLAVHWLYNQTGEEFLLELGRKIQSQTMDWTALQGRYEVGRALAVGQYRGNMGTHVVNNAQGLKTGAIWYAQTGDPWHREAPLRSFENLMRHHGQPNGVFSGDEHLHGTSPVSGTELCAVAELMYSFEECLRALGDPVYGDWLERSAFNAFPAAFRKDMWAHQYDQQVNQVLATVARRGWTDNNDTSNIFGQEPNFGCCQANFHQGLPKLAQRLVMATPDGGLALAVIAPCEASAQLPCGPVTLAVETDYPFAGRVVARVGVEGPARFPLHLRIPGWAAGAALRVVIGNRSEGESIYPQPGTFHVIEREWQPGDVVTLDLPMRVRAETGHEGLISLLRGPLLFALPVPEHWRQIGGTLPHADWEVYPTGPWNYGLALDPADLVDIFAVEVPPQSSPFDGWQENNLAPVILTVPARRIPGWGLEQNSAAVLPGLVDGNPHDPGTPVEEVELIPYGATCLRVAAFPRVNRG